MTLLTVSFKADSRFNSSSLVARNTSVSFLTEVPVYSPFFSMDLENRHASDVLLYLENGPLYTPI